MKQRPILFSAPMVRAILEGRKTQTRRFINSLSGFSKISEFGKSNTPGFDWCFRDLNMRWNEFTNHRLLWKCPYGQPGDNLWVRETWAHEYGGGYLYRASHSHMKPDGNWKPSIHMPRAASRILLKITDVRVERLNDISEWDAIDEGLEMVDGPDGIKYYGNYGDNNADTALHPIESFRTLWEAINGPGSWIKNPFVWVIEFKPTLPS